MTKKKKRFLIIFACVSFAACAVIAYFVIASHLPDYMFDDYIPKGYTQTDGHSWAGRDLDEYFYYKYDALPELHNDYTPVTKENVDEIISDVSYYEKGTQGVSFSDTISEGDLFIKHYYNQDGSYTDTFREHEKMYFYDTDTNTLYYFYYVW